jgi:hypothetical protein
VIGMLESVDDKDIMTRSKPLDDQVGALAAP